MTPAARVQASIEILDEILNGAPVEKALTGWARRSRFAGSKDRAAVRDHVFDAIRCRRSFAALGGGETGRGLMIGSLRAAEIEPGDFFTGERHTPAPVKPEEASSEFTSDAARYDIPEWLWPLFCNSLGDETIPVARALQNRAPVHLRVNLLKAGKADAIHALQADGIAAQPHPACETALEVVEGARKIARSAAYLGGLVELQDAASQAVVEKLDLRPGFRVLDYCAGGGGKSLALAAHKDVHVFAHDANVARMQDLPARAERAGAQVTILEPGTLQHQAPFDVVLVDAPCSGSGSWRRAPAGKWALTQDRLDELCALQLQILKQATQMVCEGGVLAYATCSMLNPENAGVLEAFATSRPEWRETFRKTWLVSHGTDGFFSSHLTRQ